jgi:hypothetical protein
VSDFLSSVTLCNREIVEEGGKSAERKQTGNEILLKPIKKILKFLFCIIRL